MKSVKKEISFEWDKWNQNKSFKKHKVTNREAEEAFQDKKGVIFEDIKHSKSESRFILIGKTKKGRLLFTIFTIRRKDKIRIISSRDTNRKEVPYYEKKTNTTKVQK